MHRDRVQAELPLPDDATDPGSPPAWVTEPASEEAIATAVADLDADQLAAVMHGEGPLLVVAGAGTGKTRVIAHRIAYLIAAKKAHPAEILALTFTERAAAEMEARVDLLVPYGYTDMWISTFHAFGDRLYREYALELGLPDTAIVLNEPERMVFFRERLFRLPLRRLLPLGNPGRHLAALMRLIARAKDEAVLPEDYLVYARKERAAVEAAVAADPQDPEARARLAQAERQLEIAEVYRVMDEELHAANRIDFGDQLLLALRLLREHEHVLAAVRRRFRYILVDEFQDTNVVQFELLKLLAGERRNVTVVGDDDQSIYKFRGAALSNILGFTAAYPDRKLVVLTRSYRSGQNILDAAYRLIQYNNPERLEVKESIEKRLRSMVDAPGTIEQHRHDILGTEADAVKARIAELVASGRYGYRDIAILVRSNRDAEPFLAALGAAGIPHEFSGARGLFRREEVRTAIDFMRAVARPTESQSLFALAASDVYRVPMLDLTTLADLARLKRRPLAWAMAQAAAAGGAAVESGVEGSEPLSAEGVAAIERLHRDLAHYRERSRHLATGSLLYEFLTDTGYLAELTAAETLAAEDQVRNLARFFHQVQRYEEIAVADRVHSFVDHLELLIEAGEDPQAVEPDPDFDAVRVLTVHRAKGLEFRVVFVVNLVDQKFPTTSRGEALEMPLELYRQKVAGGNFHRQEERRLFYVAMTRARELLILTSAADHGGPRLRKTSSFVLEALDLPAEAAQATGAAGTIAVLGKHAANPAPPPAPPRLVGPDETIRLSWSQIDTYRECPLRYRYGYILKAPAIAHHSQNFGKAVHAAIAEFLKGKMRGDPPPLPAVLDVLRKNWRSEGFLSREHEERRLAAGIRAIERFHAEEATSTTIPAQVEKPFSIVRGKVQVEGRFDRVDLDPDGATIIDYKTSQVEDAAEAAERARKSDQLRLYALAYAAQAGIEPRAVELRFVESGCRGRVAPSAEDLSRAEDLVAKTEDGLRRGDFTARPSLRTCDRCDFRRICPQAVW